MWMVRARLMIAVSAAWLCPQSTSSAAENGPLPAQVDAACLRHDFSGMQQLVRTAGEAVDAENMELWKKTAAAIRECMTFEVSFRSTLTKTAAGSVTTITGTATATVRLGPDIQDAGFDFATGPKGVVAPMVWSGISMTSKDCTFEIIPSPPTRYNFWLALTVAQPARGVVSISEEGAEDDGLLAVGSELHIVTPTCRGQTGVPALDLASAKGNSGVPTPMPLFGDGWTVLYGAVDPDADIEDAFNMPLTLQPGQAVIGGYTKARTEDLPGAQGTIREQTVVVITHRPGAAPTRP